MKASAAYRVQACNLSHASENKIHDDDVARRFGFRGGLVPGVEVYAYMTHLPVARWGAAWLERGTAECRFMKPVYDGKRVTVTSNGTDGALAVEVESEGERCATGAAGMAAEGAVELELGGETPIPAYEQRPDADETSLAVGRRLASHPLRVSADYLREYLAAIRETAPIYAREGYAHPALALRLSNAALKDNVKLGPWIHVGSTIRHLAASRAGDTLAARAVVAANYERGGHRFVELDVVIAADGERPIAQVRHKAIYRLRQS